MKVLKLTDKNLSEIMKEAIRVINDHGVIVSPSDTVYGLTADPTDKISVNKVYSIKKRDFNKPLGLVAGNMKIMEESFSINKTERHIMEKFWPGPLGLRLSIKNTDRMRDIARFTLFNSYNEDFPELNKIIARIPSNYFLAQLSVNLNRLVISTSANLSGESECYDAESVIDQFSNNKIKPDLVIDAGTLPKTLPSTMLDLTGDKPIIIREGACFKEVEKMLENLK